MITVKPNWIGPRATIKTQARTETELSRMACDDPNILDCLDPIRYQLPVCRKGFLRSLASSFSSLKLISSTLFEIDNDVIRHFPITIKNAIGNRNQMTICCGWLPKKETHANLFQSIAKERNARYFSLQQEKREMGERRDERGRERSVCRCHLNLYTYTHSGSLPWHARPDRFLSKRLYWLHCGPEWPT